MSQSGPFALIYVDEFEGLTINEIGVLVTLRSFGPTENRFPSHKTLAERAGTSVATVRRALDSLRDKGRLQWVSLPGSTNLYHEGEVAHIEQGGRSYRAGGVAQYERLNREVLTREENQDLAAARQQRDDHKEDQGMKPVGRLDEVPVSEPKPRREMTEDQRWRKHILVAWENAAAELGVFSWNRGLLGKILKDLRGDGYTWEEIEVLMETFFATEKTTLARKVKSGIDLSVLFRQAFNQSLEARTSKRLELLREGKPTIHQRVSAYNQAQVDEYMRAAQS